MPEQKPRGINVYVYQASHEVWENCQFSARIFGSVLFADDAVCLTVI